MKQKALKIPIAFSPIIIWALLVITALLTKAGSVADYYATYHTAPSIKSLVWGFLAFFQDPISSFFLAALFCYLFLSREKNPSEESKSLKVLRRITNGSLIYLLLMTIGVFFFALAWQ